VGTELLKQSPLFIVFITYMLMSAEVLQPIKHHYMLRLKTN